MSELIGIMVGNFVSSQIGFWVGMFYSDYLAMKRDKRIEQGINDLQNHRDTIIGKEGNEA